LNHIQKNTTMNIQWHQFAHPPVQLQLEEDNKEKLCISAQKELSKLQSIQGEVNEESVAWYVEWKKTQESIKERRSQISDNEDSTWYETLKQEWKDEQELLYQKFSERTQYFLSKEDTDTVLDTLNNNIESAQARVDENC